MSPDLQRPPLGGWGAAAGEPLPRRIHASPVESALLATPSSAGGLSTASLADEGRGPCAAAAGRAAAVLPLFRRLVDRHLEESVVPCDWW